MFFTCLTLNLFDLGKFWSSFNSISNLIELIIILFLTLEGQIHNNKFIIFSFGLTYVILINLLIILLKWPWDYIAFKAQGKEE
jgi:hypothetical protein